MTPHRHLSSEEILDSITAGAPLPDLSGCESCRIEASSLSRFLAEIRRVDAEPATDSGWDDLLLRRRIREAIARERPHGRSVFDRLSILRPAFISALAACVALVVWSPLARHSQRSVEVASLSPAPHARIPPWVPLPEESEDEGLAVLAEWTPNADEVSIASCHFSCLSGLSEHEEENLLSAIATAPARPPLTQASPL